MKLPSLLLKKPPQLQQGFSLLEALIASTIFATVLLIASSAFKFFMSIGSREVNSEQVMQDTMNSIKLRNAIKGLHHYYLRENAISLKDAKPFFWGSQDGFTGITLNAVDFSSQPTRISIAAQTDKNNITNLIYCEYNNKVAFPTAKVEPECDYPKILAANIKRLEFDYFGWSSLNALYNSAPVSLTSDKVWAREWNAAKRRLLPQYIRISIDYNEGQMPYYPTQLWFRLADADPVQFSVNTTSNE